MDNSRFLETFELDPVGEIEEDLFMQEDFSHESVIQFIKEAGSNVTRRNFGRKIWDVLKALFGWIGRQIGKLIGFIKSLFKKKTKSVDQIAEELNIPQNKNVKSDIKIEVKTNPQSTYKPDNIDLILKPLIVRLKEKDGSFVITINNIEYSHSRAENGEDDFKQGRHGKIPGQSLIKINDVGLVLHTVQHPSILNTMVNLFKNIYDPKFIEMAGDLTKEIQLIYKSMKSLNSMSDITLNQLIEVQKITNDIFQIISKLDKEISHDRVRMLLLNELAQWITSIQIGINGIGSNLKQIYQIDSSYFESIKDIDTLSNFIEKCIDGSIPVKYIANNCYCISSKELKGDRLDNDYPIWGQSRLTLFPSNNINVVYKIALSKLGIHSNITEFKISNLFKKYNEENIVSHILGKTQNNIIVSMERIDTNGIDKSLVDTILARLNQFCLANNINIPIGDVHTGNIGIKNHRPVLIDYGSTLIGFI